MISEAYVRSMVHKGDVLVQLGDDYKAQVAKAEAGVEAAIAAPRKQSSAARASGFTHYRALAGIDQAKAGISAAQAAKMRFRQMSFALVAECTRQESLLKANSATPQR